MWARRGRSNAGVAEWQTRTTQNRVSQGVWVQVPPPAPVGKLICPRSLMDKTRASEARAAGSIPAGDTKFPVEPEARKGTGLFFCLILLP